MNWREDAACRTHDPDLFFPADYRTDWAQIETAKAVCRGCPVMLKCLDTHIREPDGVFGSLTPGERDDYRKHQPDPPKRCTVCGSHYTDKTSNGSRRSCYQPDCEAESRRETQHAYDQRNKARRKAYAARKRQGAAA